VTDLRVMKTLTLAVLAHGIIMVRTDKWSDLKAQSYLEKKKRHRNLEESKLDLESYKKKEFYQKPSSKKKYISTTTEKFLKDERWQLCQSVDQDDVKNTLLKFGLVTHLFDDIQKFRKSMKSLQDQIPRSDKKKKKAKIPGAQIEKQLIREKGGPALRVSESNFVGRSLTYLASNPTQVDFQTNPFPYHLHEKDDTNTIGGRWRRDTVLKNNLRGRRKGTLKVPGQVPQCFGWKYLKALDVLSDSHTVDAEILVESVSDMLDTTFAKIVSEILETCGERLAAGGSDLCPPPEDPVEDGEEPCDNQCLVSDECQFREICCKASCGGFRCLSTTKTPKKGNSCKMADQFMQCVYQTINNNQLCPAK